MPEPVPAPTAAQIEVVAEIMMIDTSSVSDIVGSYTQEIADAKWARTLTDITAWADLVDEANDIKRVGSIEFFENTIGMSRLAFRNKVRTRYRQSLLQTEAGAAEPVSSLPWF